MKPTFFSLLPATLSLLGTAHARTDLEGCISSATTNQWHEASMVWYIEDTGEICDIPDCGGGRAPPKYDNPACPNYTGTATYEPSYLKGYGPGATATKTTARETGAESTATRTVDKSENDDEDFNIASNDHGSITITSTPIPPSYSSGVRDGGSKGSSSTNNTSSAIQSSTLVSSTQELFIHRQTLHQILQKPMKMLRVRCASMLVLGPLACLPLLYFKCLLLRHWHS